LKSLKITYGITTVIFAGMMLFSAYSYLTNPVMADGFRHLGFSDSFRVELAVAKIIGALVLLIPGLPIWLKEWAYAGFFITLISAVIAHVHAGDPAKIWVMPLVFALILAISNYCFKRIFFLERKLGN
jgi:hypothetical protein